MLVHILQKVHNKILSCNRGPNNYYIILAFQRLEKNSHESFSFHDLFVGLFGFVLVWF